MLVEKDVKDVAKSINVELSDNEINTALMLYETYQRQDCSATWNLVMEDVIYDVIKDRK